VATPTVCRVQLDRPWIVQIEGGQLEVRSGEQPIGTLNVLLDDPNKLDSGDPSVFCRCRLLESVAVPADAVV
jgi:hypothetical protein